MRRLYLGERESEAKSLVDEQRNFSSLLLSLLSLSPLSLFTHSPSRRPRLFPFRTRSRTQSKEVRQQRPHAHHRSLTSRDHAKQSTQTFGGRRAAASEGRHKKQAATSRPPSSSASSGGARDEAGAWRAIGAALIGRVRSRERELERTATASLAALSFSPPPPSPLSRAPQLTLPP
jgi:hypothetical protein